MVHAEKPITHVLPQQLGQSAMSNHRCIIPGVSWIMTKPKPSCINARWACSFEWNATVHLWLSSVHRQPLEQRDYRTDWRFWKSYRLQSAMSNHRCTIPGVSWIMTKPKASCINAHWMCSFEWNATVHLWLSFVHRQPLEQRDYRKDWRFRKSYRLLPIRSTAYQ